MHNGSTWILNSSRLKIYRPKFTYGKTSLQRNFRTAKFLHGETPNETCLGQNFLTAKFLYGEISFRWNFLTTKFSCGKILHSEISHGEISHDENSYGETSGHCISCNTNIAGRCWNVSLIQACFSSINIIRWLLLYVQTLIFFSSLLTTMVQLRRMLDLIFFFILAEFIQLLQSSWCPRNTGYCWNSMEKNKTGSLCFIRTPKRSSPEQTSDLIRSFLVYYKKKLTLLKRIFVLLKILQFPVMS